MDVPDRKEAYTKALKLLASYATEHGFIAAKSKEHGNYDRIWGRDSMICSLAGLMSGDERLVQGCKRSLKTLMEFQHAQGQIPSNADPKTGGVSYGGTTGRVDAHLWFLIGLAQYVKRTQDMPFAKEHFASAQKVMGLLRHYEFNDKGLLYIPQTGDWADEWLQRGYVLYDELLYYQALRDYEWLCEQLEEQFEERSTIVRKRIEVNYWLDKHQVGSEQVYHRVLYERTFKAVKYEEYFLPYFTPSEYGTYFDLFANSLAILLGIATKQQASRIHKHTKHISKPAIPAFSPVITQDDPRWQQLLGNYSHSFRNHPHEYSNGGVYPMVLGWYAASLKKEGGWVLDMINALNAQDDWEFNEVHHGKTLKGNGTKHQAWSAAATIMAQHAVRGEDVLL